MLEKLKLDHSDYNNTYEKAMQWIDAHAPWWTHRETADPGITLLEMWALLGDMQSFYMDQVQESHYRKYLKLLGMLPDQGQYASVLVHFENIAEDTVLPEGTRLLADTMVFETAQEVRLTANRLTRFYLGQDACGEEEDYFYLMDRFRKTSFRLPKGKMLFTIVLQRKVETGDTISFYVLLDETGGRNPAGEGFTMVPLVWEYLTEEGYKEAYVEKDGTKGLLYSGFVTLRIDRPMFLSRSKNGYPVRCCRKEEKAVFDVQPAIYRVFLNMVQVFQKNTLCREELFSFDADAPKICLKSYPALTGEIRVYAKCGDGEWEDFTESCEITPPVTAEQKTRYLIFDKIRFGRIPESGRGTVKIVCSHKEIEKDFPCTVTGVSAQQISLPWENLRRDSVRVMLRQKGNRFREYLMAEPEDDRERFAWHWLGEDNVIELGNGRHGEIPLPAEKGFWLTGLVLWEGDHGNVAIDRINRLERPDLFPGILCRNLMSGKGGKNREKPSAQFGAVRESFSRKNRMVSGEDIGSLAMETPGLMLDKAYAGWEDGRILVTVFPSAPLNEYCKKRYITEVRNHLEQYRLVGTRIEVEIGVRNSPVK